MNDFGLWSLAPPAAAITMAIATRRVVVSLLAGVLLAALIEAGGNPVAAGIIAGEDLLWDAVAGADGSSHLRVFAFTLLMGAMVGVIHRTGAMKNAVDAMLPLASDRRSGQLVGWAMGLAIFFDDYANTLLLGNALRPLFDRLRISREKLAYLVDSTAAPVAGLALVSTWVAGEIGYIDEGVSNVQQAAGANCFLTPVDGFALFVASIPYRFYVLFALGLVPLVALLNREFGPMVRAEQDALKNPRAATSEFNAADATGRKSAPWHAAVIPIGIMLATVVILLITTGFRWRTIGRPPSMMEIFGNADSYIALVYGALAGFAAAAATAFAHGFSVREIGRGARSGAFAMLPAMAILWLAWSLSTATNSEHLNTAAYLMSWLDASQPGSLLSHAVVLVPTVVFLLASVVAFCTGTSWGTMAILTPLVMETSFRLLTPDGGPLDPANPIFVGSVGSVLAGAIFGDHCSPISDTTVLSSQSSGCDHIAHVRTQLPYALLAAAAAILFGTLPAGFGVSPLIVLPIGFISLLACLLIFGKRITEPSDS
ncbi:MAG: hypothetical protein NXI22_06255 [bacterium]|nr:hypothetical protein [bacterium]